MAYNKTYRTYRFMDKDKDPIIDAIRTIVQDEHLNNNQVATLSGVAGGTLANWFDGDTRRPNNVTTTAVTSALGYVRRDSLTRDGMVQIGYTKARNYDWRKEITAAADWLIAQNKPKRKRAKKKKNGHA